MIARAAVVLVIAVLAGCGGGRAVRERPEVAAERILTLALRTPDARPLDVADTLANSLHQGMRDDYNRAKLVEFVGYKLARGPTLVEWTPPEPVTVTGRDATVHLQATVMASPVITCGEIDPVTDLPERCTEEQLDDRPRRYTVPVELVLVHEDGRWRLANARSRRPTFPWAPKEPAFDLATIAAAFRPRRGR